MSAQFSLNHGNNYPYDADDVWWRGTGRNPPPPIDWAHSAARGVITDLKGRRGIKHEFAQVDEKTRAEIVQSLAAIIRLARDSDPQDGFALLQDSRGNVRVFEIKGNECRAAITWPGVISKWGHFDRTKILSPIRATVFDALKDKETF